MVRGKFFVPWPYRRSLLLVRTPSSRMTMRLRTGHDSSPTSWGSIKSAGWPGQRAHPISTRSNSSGMFLGNALVRSTLRQQPWLGRFRFCRWSGMPSLRPLSRTLCSRCVADVKHVFRLGAATHGIEDISVRHGTLRILKWGFPLLCVCRFKNWIMNDN